jgi:hypothetical protein
MKLVIATTIVLAVYVAIATASGGIAVTLSNKGINYVLAQVLPIVEKKFENMTIPGITGKVRSSFRDIPYACVCTAHDVLSG